VQVIGVNLFETTPRILTERILNVSPGTTYRLSTFLTEMNSQVIFNTTNGNNLTLVLEYTI
jgi:hypothetical protein